MKGDCRMAMFAPGNRPHPIAAAAGTCAGCVAGTRRRIVEGASTG